MTFTSQVCADHADQRVVLVELLARQMAETPVERVNFAFEINGGDGASTLRLASREALFMLPGSWRRALADESHTHSTIVFEKSSIGFFARHCGPNPPPQPQFWFRTPHPIVTEGLDLIHALSAIARSGRNLEVAPTLVRTLLRIAHAQLADAPTAARDPGEGVWLGMCAFIREHYHQALGRETLAATFAVHPNQVSRLFGRYGKEGFNQFLVRTRMESATALLRTSSFTIAEVALRSGFHDDNYFRSTFRRFFGMPPGQFRERVPGRS